MADKKYIGNKNIITIYDIYIDNYLKFNSVRTRIEHVNGFLKNFGVLKESFRHNKQQHEMIFKIICFIYNLKVKMNDIIIEE